MAGITQEKLNFALFPLWSLGLDIRKKEKIKKIK